MLFDITYVVGTDLAIWSFNRGGVCEGSATSTSATPVLKWLWREKPKPCNANNP